MNNIFDLIFTHICEDPNIEKCKHLNKYKFSRKVENYNFSILKSLEL